MIGVISSDLPQLLARQEAEVQTLAMQKRKGTLSDAIYQRGLAENRASRAELAETLMLSSAQARTASANLRDAAARGQTGLEWYISAVDQMELDTTSARSSISLL